MPPRIATIKLWQWWEYKNRALYAEKQCWAVLDSRYLNLKMLGHLKFDFVSWEYHTIPSMMRHLNHANSDWSSDADCCHRLFIFFHVQPTVIILELPEAIHFLIYLTSCATGNIIRFTWTIIIVVPPRIATIKLWQWWEYKNRALDAEKQCWAVLDWRYLKSWLKFDFVSWEYHAIPPMMQTWTMLILIEADADCCHPWGYSFYMCNPLSSS